MKAKNPLAITFLEWLLDQSNRQDQTGYYAKAVIDDFNNGNEFNLANTALPSKLNELEITVFSDYCVKNNIDTAFANVLLLGHIMAIMEYNIGIITDQIPHAPLYNESADKLRQRIAICCDLIPAILQDINSDMKAEGIE